MEKINTLEENILMRNKLIKLFNSEIIGVQLLIFGIKNGYEINVLDVDFEFPLPIPEKILKDFIENLFHHFQSEIINETHKS